MADVTNIDEARSALSYALRYIRLGWHVLPLDPGTKKPLGRLVRNGFHDATTDEATARRWWTQQPDAGIGVALKASGLVAVDIDPRNGGIETIDALEHQHGAIASDVLAFTGGGGEHRVFAAELVENLPGKLGAGVDLKADGYIAVEPTLHPSGRQYSWEASSDPLDGVVPSTLPSWIRDLGRGAPAVAGIPATAPMATPIDPRRRASALEALQHIASDDRDTWFTVGMAIHQEMPTQDGFDLWATWSATSPKFDAQDQLRVWRSFRRRPMGERRVDLTMVFATAQRAGWKNTGGPIDVKEEAPAGVPMLSLTQLREASQSITWSVKHIIPADSIGVMFGGSGTFKSFIALDFALHVAHGLPWLGRKTKQGAVVFIAAEGGAGLWRRVEAWHKARGLKWAAIEFYVVPVAVALGKHAAKVVDAANAVSVAPAVVIVDTMSQTFDGEENSANEVASYLRELGTAFRALWRCVVLVIHHSGHQATERPRGSSAIRSNVDFLFGVFRDEKEMLATFECQKQKDGELFEEQTFALSSETLGADEDGESISSLVATHVNGATELLEAHAREAQAGRSSGRYQLLCSLAQTGMTEKELRHAFYSALPDMQMDAKKKAFYDNRAKAMKLGVIDIGFVSGSLDRVVIKAGGQ